MISFKKILFAVSIFIFFYLAVSFFSFQEARSATFIEVTKKNSKNYIEELVIHDGKKIIVYNRDIRIWPEGSQVWDWRKAGTHHIPGIQIADIADLLPTVSIVILTRGVDGILEIPQATIDYCNNAGKTVYTGRTYEMIALYNSLLQEGKKVAAVIHLTC